MIAFSVEFESSRPAKALCDAIFDVTQWSTFEGYGPLPGIAEAEIIQAGVTQVGTKFREKNRDGSHHEETVIDFVAGHAITLRMDNFPVPVRHIASHFIERWAFEARGNMTSVTRTFELHPRNLFGSVVLRIVAIIFRRAVENHSRRLARE